MNNKFLVRDLIIIEGRVEKKLSLHYITYDKEKISINPYDRERAGYIYCSRLVISKTEDGWEIKHKSE